MHLAKRITIVFTAVSLVMAGSLAIGCTQSPSTSTPGSITTLSPSQYPADISGYVLVVDKVVATFQNKTRLDNTPLGPDRVFWIVDVSVKNNNYTYPVNSVWNKSMPMPKGIQSNIIWSILINDKVWSGLEPPIGGNPVPMSASKGQSGTTRFLCEAMRNVNPSDAGIRYAGEEPFSYGKMRETGKAAVYDWDLNKVIAATATPVNQAWSHVGYIKEAFTFTGTGVTRVIFQDGFSVTYAGETRANLLPPPGAKFEIKYQYDAKSGQNILISLLPVP